MLDNVDLDVDIGQLIFDCGLSKQNNLISFFEENYQMHDDGKFDMQPIR
jgi:hypothetical protein